MSVETEIIERAVGYDGRGGVGTGLEFRPTENALWQVVESISRQPDGRWRVSSWSHGYTDIAVGNLRIRP